MREVRSAQRDAVRVGLKRGASALDSESEDDFNESDESDGDSVDESDDSGDGDPGGSGGKIEVEIDVDSLRARPERKKRMTAKAREAVETLIGS